MMRVHLLYSAIALGAMMVHRRRLDLSTHHLLSVVEGYVRPGAVLRANRLLLAVVADFDAAGLCFFGHRDGQPQHTVVVGGRDLIGVQVVTKEQLSTEDASGSFGGDHLPVLIQRRAF